MNELLRQTDTGTILHVRVTPKASADRLGGVYDHCLKIAVTVAPEKGKANEQVIKLLAKKLRLPKGAVRVVAGETDRRKSVLLQGLSPQEVRDRLGLCDDS